MIDPKVQIPWFLTFLVVSVLFTIGLSSPDWIYVKDKFRWGLWLECMGTKLTCKSLVGADIPGRHTDKLTLKLCFNNPANIYLECNLLESNPQSVL